MKQKIRYEKLLEDVKKVKELFWKEQEGKLL